MKTLPCRARQTFNLTIMEGMPSSEVVMNLLLCGELKNVDHDVDSSLRAPRVHLFVPPHTFWALFRNDST